MTITIKQGENPMTTKRYRFCDRKLMYYLLDDDNNRNYDENDAYLKKLVEADLVVGTRKEKDSEEVRYIKLMFQTVKKKTVKKYKKRGKYLTDEITETVPNPPQTLQQDIKKFPQRLLIVQGRIAIQSEDSYAEVVKSELATLHEKCVRILVAHSKEEQADELQERWEKLTWQTYKTDVRGRKSKEEKISDFLKGFDFGT